MDLSQDTTEVLNFLDHTTGNNLLKRNDLGTILEIGASEGNHRIVNKIIFTGKSLWNLWSLLRKSTPDDEGYDIIFNEFRKSSIELSVMISGMIEPDNEEIRQRFATVYFAGTDGSTRNLVDLAHDLSALRDVQLELKRQPKI